MNTQSARAPKDIPAWHDKMAKQWRRAAATAPDAELAHNCRTYVQHHVAEAKRLRAAEGAQ